MPKKQLVKEVKYRLFSIRYLFYEIEVSFIFKPHFPILFQRWARAEPSKLKRAKYSVLNWKIFCIWAFALAGTRNKRPFFISSLFHISYIFVLIVSNEKFFNWNFYFNFAFIWPIYFYVLYMYYMKTWYAKLQGFCLILYMCRFYLKPISWIK